jgi:hypothetical protein
MNEITTVDTVEDGAIKVGTHFIVVSDSKNAEEMKQNALHALTQRQESFPGHAFILDGAISKSSGDWISMQDDAAPFTADDVKELMKSIITTSPFGTTDDIVQKAMDGRDKQTLRYAAQHLMWLHTIVGLDLNSFDVWTDNVFPEDLTLNGLTNLTVEFESEPEETWLVKVDTLELLDKVEE